ncbi:hypothetical protein CLAIMM_06371 [Cladophialophora immunda]|nr:hypothetical protein CLAIMM_06371 [Cladophialophora immunda]
MSSTTTGTTTSAAPNPSSLSPAEAKGTGTGTGTFTLLLFASASTFAGGLETLRFPAPTTLRGVFEALEARFPGMRAKVLRSAAVTVNLEYVDFDLDADADAGDEGARGGGDAPDDRREEARGSGLDLVIRDGDEVGIIPPVSSG